MTPEEKIISYLFDHGFDISPYIAHNKYSRPGKICIHTICDWGFGWKREDWDRLMSILSNPNCPVVKKCVISEIDGHNSVFAYDYLVWMTTEDKIISYLRDHGLDITRYIDTYRHVIPDTVCFSAISMWGIQTSGKYEHWVKLKLILDSPYCPIRMVHVRSAEHERPNSFERLVWEGEKK